MKIFAFPLVAALVATSVTVFGLSACGKTMDRHGQILPRTKVEQLHVGVTTKQQVESLLGSPSTTSSFASNRWYYVTSSTVSKPLNPNILQERQILVLDFDDKGILSALNTKTKADGKDISPNENVTETQGQSLTITDQLLNNIGGGIGR